MRDFKGMKRQRGRNRKPGGGSGNANAANPNRSWDSQGPENIKVRGNAQTVYERYQQLGRDATASGDRVLAENYLQHAEHYFRVLRALQPQRPVSEIAARELSNQGYDIDFEDETGAQAAAFLAAQQAADRAAQQASEPREGGEQPREPREWRDRDQNQNRDRDQNRNREWQPRPPRDDQAPRVQTEGGQTDQGQGDEQGGRRESRRERWERRRDERNARYEAEGRPADTRTYEESEGREGGRDGGRDGAREGGREGPAYIASTAPLAPAQPRAIEAQPEPAPAATQDERPARRTRTPRAQADDGASSGSALPGFLTRSSAPAPAAAPEGDAAEAPKKRAPRRKAEAPSESQ